MVSFFKRFFLWFIIVAILAFGYIQFYGNFNSEQRTIIMSEFLDNIEADKIYEVQIKQSAIFGKFIDGGTFKVNAIYYDSLIDKLRAHKVKIEIVNSEGALYYIGNILLSWLPMILFVAFWIFFLNKMQAGNMRALGFAKSRAKLFGGGIVKTKLEDVGGISEAKEELVEIIDFLKDQKKYQALGGKIPRGVLLIGPPGSGKTLLAKAIAGEAAAPFFSISGSDFVEMFVGVGASRVRDMFTEAKKQAPCLVFIDEIDSVGRHRGVGIGGGNDEREQTLNQLLVELDGFEPNSGIIVIAATNRPDVLDPALLRPGRFDRRVIISLPDSTGREEILNIHLKNTSVPLAPDVDIKVLSRSTPGFSGADLMNLVNESALSAAKHNQAQVNMKNFDEAKDKILMGAARKSMVILEKEKKLTAFHEAGHALIALTVKGSDPIYKATIIPRGGALGMVVRLPENDRVSVTREKLLADLTVAMGGRAAEEIVFGSEYVTSGASSDIKAATEIARSMVYKWGMSEKIGMIYYGSNEDLYTHDKSTFSDKTAENLDSEVKNFIDISYSAALDILRKNFNKLERIANALLERETLLREEIEELISDKKDNIDGELKFT